MILNLSLNSNHLAKNMQQRLPINLKYFKKFCKINNKKSLYLKA